MADANEDLIRAAYAAYASGDIDALRQEFLAPDIRGHYPGTSPLAGHRQGAEVIADDLRLRGRLSGGTHRLELHDVLAIDGHVVTLHTARAERDGRNLEISEAMVFRITDGKVAEAWTLHTDPQAADEFWS